MLGLFLGGGVYSYYKAENKNEKARKIELTGKPACLTRDHDRFSKNKFFDFWITIGSVSFYHSPIRHCIQNDPLAKATMPRYG